MRIFSIIVALALFAAVPQASAGTLGCLLGAAAGGFGGAQIGSGNGQLAAVGAGTLLGCGVGSSIQNSDQQRYQAPRQRIYQPPYRPQYGQRDYYINYSYDRRRVPYTVARPVYYQRRYQPRPQIVWQQPQQRVVQSNRYCREYQAPMITIGGKQVEGYGQACSYDGGRTWALGDLRETQ